MVQTRNQWRQWIQHPTPPVSQASQGTLPDLASLIPSQLSSIGLPVSQSSDNMQLYRPNDHCKRNRLPDNEPSTERVRMYTRRKAIR